MLRLIPVAFLAFALNPCLAQPRQISLGIFSGITASYTWDEGIQADSRYKDRYDVKLAPIGINYGIDFQGYGFVLTPSIVNIGQNYHVINTVGGHEGTRKINAQYFSLPIGVKLHVIDLSFFKVSLVAGAGLGYLMQGKETITHNYAKYRFPTAVYPVLPPEYIIEYDGVIAPAANNRVMLEKKDFNSLQVFGSGGFRSDWDVSENWRVSLDVRINYGIWEPRSESYLNRVAAHQTLYDIEGKRRDIFAYINVGISRYIEIDKEKESKTKSSKKFIPKKAMGSPRPPKYRKKKH